MTLLAERVAAEDPHARAALDGIPRVVADEVAALYLCGKNVWDYRTDFGPLRPPFPEMWVEARFPRRVFVDNEWCTSPLEAAGAGLTSAPGDVHPMLKSCEPRLGRIPELADAPVVTAVHPYVLAHGKVSPLPIVTLIAAADDGVYLTHRSVADEAVIREETLVARWVMLAVGFMHCKNVTVDSVAARPVQRRDRRCDRPRYSFSVIHLPGAAGTKDATRSAAGAVQPLHIVRGHFKTYTPDAPLFGTKVGTYWWSHHLRGDEAAGVYGHAYEVGAP